MSWTAYKKRMRKGAKLYIYNMRRPSRSRHVVIVSRSKRSCVVQDVKTHDLASLEFPPAAFTRMIDGNDVEYLADANGPRFDERGNIIGEILAGSPFMTIRIEGEAP
jgi:hypothetical protein